MVQRYTSELDTQAVQYYGLELGPGDRRHRRRDARRHEHASSTGIYQFVSDEFRRSTLRDTRAIPRA
jgi:hypothetical protein